MPCFYDRFAEAAARFPGRTAIEVQRADRLDAVSYRDLEVHAESWAVRLRSDGIHPGDRCAILADNDADWVAAYLGILRLGAVAVPLDTAYRAPQIRAIAESAEPRVVFTTAKYEAAVRSAIADITPAPQVIDLAALRLRSGQAPAAPGAPIAPDAPAVILYTSGTTSDPKGVVLTHANLEAERAGAFDAIHVTEEDAILGVLPLFHSLAQMANLLLPLSRGARVVFLESVNSTSLLRALDERGITIFACVPQFFYLIHDRVMSEIRRAGFVRRTAARLLLRTNGWLRDRVRWNPGTRWFARVHRLLGAKMRIFITGGSGFDPAIARDLRNLGLTLLNGYGLTETSGAATVMRPEDPWHWSVGRPLTGVEIAIAPKRGTEPAAPPEPNAEEPAITGPQDGEILIRGPIVMQGYYRRPDATADALHDGWLHTGDLGYLDAAGCLHITGRSKEIIVLASGKNIYPEEVEAHYRQSPFIKELAVLGLGRAGAPSAERLHAVIVPDEAALRQRGIVNVREIIRFELETLSVQVAPHKRVLSYDIWLEPLPRTTTGKIRRQEVERRVRANAPTDTPRDAPPLDDAARAWLADEANAALVALMAARLDRRVVRPDAHLELDLDLDSMERVELLAALEQQAGTHVASEVRATIFTVRQFVDAVRGGERGLAAAATASPWDALLAQPIAAGIERNLRRSKIIRAAVVFACLQGLALAARVVLGLRVSGRTQVPAAAPFIITPNHQSYLDSIVVLSQLPFDILRRVFFVGASEYFETPFARWFAQAFNIVPVDPDANLVKAMQAGAAGLRLGKVLVLFPEGERSIDGGLGPFKKGAAILASHLGVAMVPVALDGLFQLWPRGRGFNWRGLLPGRVVPLRIAFGPPLRVAPGQDAEGTPALAAAIQAMFAEVRAGVDASGSSRARSRQDHR